MVQRNFETAPRVNVQLVVTLTFDNSQTVARGISLNLSETGALVRTTRTAPLGTVAELEFKDFKAKGEIIWRKETDEDVLLGMRFVSLGRRGRNVIRSFVEFVDAHG